jgi:hypothetical protein
MRKIILGLVAASVAIPTVAAAQPGYYGGGGYYGGNGGGYYSHPYDRNGDGVVTRREAERSQRQAVRQQQRYYNGGYGSQYGQYNQYGQSSQYSQYYDRSGYYSGPTWRGNDGRYYCRRSNGETGTIVGGAAGALIGSQVAGRGDRTIGAILGGAVGAIIGRSADRQVRCN